MRSKGRRAETDRAHLSVTKCIKERNEFKYSILGKKQVLVELLVGSLLVVSRVLLIHSLEDRIVFVGLAAA